MSIKPQFESYRYIGEICRLRGQSVVECRLPGSEIGGVLAVYAKAIAADCTCTDGEVQYGGRVTLTVVYEDGDKKVCRAERGAEFYHKAEGAQVSPSCFAKALLSTENVTWRREGSGLYITVIVAADLAVYGGKQIDYLVGGEGLTVKKDVLTLCKTVCVTGETEGEDAFDSDYVGDILLHSQTAVVQGATASGGEIGLDGEIALNICVLTGENAIGSYERLIPFRMQIPAEEGFGDVTVTADVQVKQAHLTATVDEEKGRSKLVLSYVLCATCFLHIREELGVASDAFSTTAETTVKYANDGGRYLTKRIKCTERVGGAAALSPIVDSEFSLQAAVLPRAEISVKRTERGLEAEGAVLADVLLVSPDGAHRNATLSLPFAFPLDVDGEDADVQCLVCGLNVRRKKSGETEAEATLKCSVSVYGQRTWAYVCEVHEGAPYPTDESAFSVFLPRTGEELWGLAKRLGCDPDELQKSNPTLQFPLKGDERIFVYRQIT